MQIQAKDIHLSEGLEGQDVNIDALQGLWEELQLVSVEASGIDLISFASALTTLYFGVITLGNPPSDQDQEPSQESFDEVPPSSQSNKFSDYKSNMPKDDYQIAVGDVLEKLKQQSFTTVAGTSSAWQQPSSISSRFQQANEHPWRPNTWTAYAPVVDAKPPIGIIFLTTSQFFDVIDRTGEVSIGIILDSKHRGHGYARQAADLVLAIAFNRIMCHRVQAALVDNYRKDSALTLFMQMRFGHEGTRRRSFFSPVEREWKDVTYLAILDTEYMMRSYFKAAPKSLWDELFLRHDREREALLRWEDNRARMKRTASAETIQMAAAHVTTAPVTGKGKDKCVSPSEDDDYRETNDASASHMDNDDEEAAYTVSKFHVGILPISRSPSPPLSHQSSDRFTDARSGSSSPIDWDMVDHSSGNSSNVESLVEISSDSSSGDEI